MTKNTRLIYFFIIKILSTCRYLAHVLGLQILFSRKRFARKYISKKHFLLETRKYIRAKEYILSKTCFAGISIEMSIEII